MLKFIPSKDEIITELQIDNDGYKELNLELKNKLNKYEKAFEILKKVGNIKVQIRKCKENKWYEVGFIYYGVGYYREIEKEEYELLEELMKDEK